MYLIGLTGNIATGKSTVLRMLKELGADVIDADLLAHEVMQKGTPAYHEVVQTFGQDMLGPDGEIDRRKLGSIVFADREKLQCLEEIVHPAVGQKLEERLQQVSSAVAVIEAIKLIEAGLHQRCDALWVVTCSPDQQLKRLVKMGRLTESEARQRIEAQPPATGKIKLADVIIDNSRTPLETWRQVQVQWRKIEKRLAHGRPEEIQIRRARKEDLPAIAQLINRTRAKEEAVDQEELLARFLEWGYLVASNDHFLGTICWQAMNLVACIKDFHVRDRDQWPHVGSLLLETIEKEAKTLLCEVALLFADPGTPVEAMQLFAERGYAPERLEELNRVWREVALECLKEGDRLLVKRLRWPK
ncbi:MAG: dephospho-CoA kinase [Anaerolineae bacterium]